MQKAQLITSADDLIQAMQWQVEQKKATQTSMLELMLDLTELQRNIMQKLSESEEGWHVNQLVMELQLPYNEVASELMMMELQGMVKGLPGGLWRRIEK
jgi:DNA processing protein